MKHVTYGMLAALTAIAACTASGTEQDPGPDASDDAAAPDDDGGVTNDAETDAAPDSSTFDPDAQAPLVCGDAGFCETRLPASDLGQPVSLQSVWVVGANDVWSVSSEGAALHFDGTTWTTEHRTHHPLSSVWATSTSVWIGGEFGILAHRSPTGEWARIETGRTSRIRSIYGQSDDDVWFASDDGSVLHFDGTSVGVFPIAIPDLRITTVFGRPGAGVYAAGYVEGAAAKPTTGQPPNRFPYVVALDSAGATVFNTNLQSRKGFVPVAAQVTDSPTESSKLFLFGYAYKFKGSTLAAGYDLVATYFPLGPSVAPALKTLSRPDGNPIQYSGFDNDPPPSYPVWAKQWNDVLMPYSRPYFYMFDLRWNGATVTSGSLAMGRTFPPRAIFGVHGTATDTWLVGDGFALKGTTP